MSWQAGGVGLSVQKKPETAAESSRAWQHQLGYSTAAATWSGGDTSSGKGERLGVPDFFLESPE